MKPTSLFKTIFCIGSLLNWFKIIHCGKCSEVVSEERQLYRRCIHVRTLDLTSIPPHICTLECLRRQNCLFTNYNTDKSYCLLIDDKCMQWEVDNEFELRYLGLPRQKCVSWVPVSVFKPTLVVSYAGSTYAGRWRDALNTVPGKYVPSHGVIYVAMGDATHTYSDGIEVLQKHPECQVVWLAYTAGEPIPDGAVVGGSLSTEAGTNLLYVIRAQGAVDDQFGYYNPDTNLGYVPTPELQYTKMDIMALQ